MPQLRQGLTGKTTKKRGKIAAPRKEPQQERSRRRLDAIVEAAADSFAEFGFDATTMEGIAATASTSIGSMYQFFPNKKAVFREVAQRAIAASGATFASLMLPGSQRPWPELLDQVCDLYFELHHSSVMMRAMVRNFELYREFETQDEAQRQGFVQIVGVLLGTWVPNLPPGRSHRIAQTLVSTFAMSMLVIAGEPKDVGLEMLTETKLMLRRYLEGYAPEPG